LQISFTLIKPISITLGTYSSVINFLFYSSGIFLLLTHRKEVWKIKIGSLKKRERTKENKIKRDFQVGDKTSLFFLILILIGFTIMKAPYFDYNFTGANTMKYNTYVEPAKYMIEKGDFTWLQHKYLANPTENPEGIRESLPQLPILEWSLATTFKLLPNRPIEVSTRLLTHTMGLITLVLVFLLTKKWTNNTYSLIVTTFMATNRIIGITSFVTVYDTVIFISFLTSLYLLTKYLQNGNKLSNLWIAGIITGLGISAKISLLIWILPASFLIIFFDKEKTAKKVFNFLTFYFFAGVIYLTTKYSIPNLRLNFNRSLVLLSVGLLVVILSYYLIKKYKEKAMGILQNLEKKKLLIPLFLLILGVVASVGASFLLVDRFTEHFLTDQRILFSLPLYKHMLTEQFSVYVSRNIFRFSLLGFISLFFVKNRKVRILNITLLVTALFYWVIASKSIFIHDYYTLVFMYSFILAASLFIYIFISLFKKPSVRLLLSLLLGLYLITPTIKETRRQLSFQRDGFMEAAEYLEENTEPNDLYIDESHLLTLTLETGRARVGDPNMFNNEDFKEAVEEIGFKGAMEEYNVKYLITSNTVPSYEGFADVFAKEDLRPTLTARESKLLPVATPEDFSNFVETERRGFLVDKYDIDERFVFEKEIGVYRFFRFRD
jgi:4-amino-4-deoxy-L-arabinose transferase-like glycosyltransferase